MQGRRVRAEPIQSEKAEHGLVDTAWPGQFNPDWESADDWKKGVQWRPTGCVEASAWNPNCSAFPKEDKSDPPEISQVYEVDAFVIETAYGCTLVGNAGNDVVDEYRQTALDQLDLSTSKALEYQFWTGTLGSRMQSLDSTALEITGLSSAATVISGSAGFDRQVGLALAGQALANCGAGNKGMIHAPPWIVELWFGDGLLVEDDDGNLVTPVRGDRVVAGSGYPGTGPGGVEVTGTMSWIFATSPVEVYLEPITDESLVAEDVSEVFERTKNLIEWRAERLALVRFDPCCHIAVLVDGASSGGG